MISTTCCSYYVQCLDREWVNILRSPPVTNCSSQNNWGGIFAVLTADTVATGKLNCYNFVVHVLTSIICRDNQPSQGSVVKLDDLQR